jgi:hypothetical protein
MRTASSIEFDPRDAMVWNAWFAEALENCPFHSDNAPKP